MLLLQERKRNPHQKTPTRRQSTWYQRRWNLGEIEEPISLDENFDVILSTLDRILNKLLLYVHFNICNIPVID